MRNKKIICLNEVKRNAHNLIIKYIAELMFDWYNICCCYGNFTAGSSVLKRQQTARSLCMNFLSML